MTAPTDAELAAMERRRWSHVYHGDGNTAEDDVDALIAALREARATIADLEDELVAARQPTDDLEGALEIVKVDNEDLRAQLAEARADTQRLSDLIRLAPGNLAPNFVLRVSTMPLQRDQIDTVLPALLARERMFANAATAPAPDAADRLDEAVRDGATYALHNVGVAPCYCIPCQRHRIRARADAGSAP